MKGFVFFDLDGTLVDVSERYYRVYKDILKFYSKPYILSKMEFWNHKRSGKKVVDIIPTKVSKQFIQEFIKEWFKRIEDKEYLKYDKLFQESLRVLLALKEEYMLVLVTLRNNKEALIWELNNFGLTSYFKEILMGSQLKTKTQLIKDYLGRNKEDYGIIVGDTEIDILAGKELGLVTIAVTYGIRTKDFLSRFNADFYLDSISKLPSLLKRIGKKL